MKVSTTDKGENRVLLTISADADDMVSVKNHALKHLAANIKVPGFRQGTAPLALVEKNAPQQSLVDEFLDHALNHFYRQAVTAQNLKPVGSPNVQLKKFVPFSDLEFEAEMDTIGPIKLGDYKTIKLSKPKVEVTAKDVNEVITTLRQRLAARQTVGRPAKAGDELIINFNGFDDKGRPVGGADAKDYPLLLGSNTFIPGFEDHLKGKKPAEHVEFSLTFPKDYGVSALQAKKVTFKVDIKTVSELKLPEINDEFAKKAGPFKDVAQLKADIKKQLQTDRQNQVDRQYENDLIAKIVDKSVLTVPKQMIDEQVVEMEAEERRNLSYRGQTWEEHLKAEGITDEQHKERQKPLAEQRIKGGLVLAEIAQRENIEVTPEELEMRLQILKGQYTDKAMQAELDKPENRSDIAARLLTEKTIAKLREYTSK